VPSLRSLDGKVVVKFQMLRCAGAVNKAGFIRCWLLQL